MGCKITPSHNQHILLATMAISLFALIMAVLYMINGAKVCPLCLLQQGIFILVFIIACLGLITQRYQRYNNLPYWLITIVALAGFILAAWQIYLQLNPTGYTCGLSIEQLFAFLPVFEALTQMFSSSDCSSVNASFLGVSLAWYSALIYLTFLLINISALRVQYRNHKSFNNNQGV